MENKLKFTSFASSVANGFWFKLQANKLHIYKLDESSQPIKGFYTNTDAAKLPCRLSVDHEAFQADTSAPPLCYTAQGTLHNKNTIEGFKNTDHKALLAQEGKHVWGSIVSGDAIKNPQVLVRFCLLSFADLKKFKFYYWFAFPVLTELFDVSVAKNSPFKQLESTETNFSASLLQSVQQFTDTNSCLPPFFAISTTNADTLEVAQVHHLTEVESLLESNKRVLFGFCDPSTLDGYPGQPLRNFLALIKYHWAEKLGEVEVVCYRERFANGKREISHSIYLKLALKSVNLEVDEPSYVGWEKHPQGKLCPRVVKLAGCMDPSKLAQSSVNLNLKLMQWRLMPDLKLDMVANTKCLLLGSGTLGCYVARGLLGWGVTNITMVDCGQVSFSNPVRQSLFEFSDCALSGGKAKAVAAANMLKKIYPGVNAVGVELMIPMPGHPVHNSEKLVEKMKADVDQLTELIKDHDVIYLLMDTRESRWLPSVIGAAYGKLVISAAIGFDTYLVIRHGALEIQDDGQPVYDAERLGCYFCGDIVSPSNSTNDRTLDQQCTVSRPGVSMIASAMAVELMASVLHHPKQALAKGCNFNGQGGLESSMLGPVAHQIRGMLHNYEHMFPMTPAFDKCTACSQVIIEQFRNQGHDFLLKVFNSSATYLEDISGLTQLKNETAAIEDDVLEYGDDELVCD